MSMWIVIALAVISIGLLAVVVARGSDVSLLQVRLGVSSDSPHGPISDPTRPFQERLLFPLLAKLGRFLLALTPSSRVIQVERALGRAGDPPGLTAQTIITLQILLVAMAVVVDILILISGGLGLAKVLLLVLILVAAGAGPSVYLSSLARRRRVELLRSYAPALELLVLSVETGLTLDASMARVGEQLRSPMSEEFVRVLNEINVGRSRAEALRDMAARLEIVYVSRFVQAVIQSEELGVGIALVLREHVREYRMAHRQEIQTKAGQAPIKLIFPMVGCIFPTIWIPLVGPAILLAFNLFRGNGAP